MLPVYFVGAGGVSASGVRGLLAVSLPTVTLRDDSAVS